MASEKLLNYDGLSYYHDQLKELFITVDQETGDLAQYAKKSDIPTIATVDKAGIVKPDGSTVKITAEGVISSPNQDLSGLATKTELGSYALKSELPKAATQEAAGLVKPGTGLSVTDDGTLNAQEVDLSNYVQTEAIQDMLTKTEAAADYATKEELSSDYATKTELDGYVEDSEITDMETKTHAGSTYATKTEAATKAELADYAKKADISSVYKPQGSIEFTGLEGLNIAANVGNVYNITDPFVTTEDFVEGASGVYPGGTNVVVVQDSDTYKFDVLSGVVDLTPYMKSADIATITHEEIDTLFAPVI